MTFQKNGDRIAEHSEECFALIAQLDRVTGYEPVGRGFESLSARHNEDPVVYSAGSSFFCKRKKRAGQWVCDSFFSSEARGKEKTAREALVLCAIGIPIGSLLGAAATVALKTGADAYMSRGGMVFPVQLKITPLSAAAAVITVLLPMLLFSLRSCRNLSVRNASAQMRDVLSADIGIGTFTDDSRKYRILGIPHDITLRNISNHPGKYAGILL